MNELIKKIVKLLDVKSIVYLVGSQVVDGDKFMSIYTMIVGFYFGVQSTKSGTSKE